ncbi:MAG: hypothetical protein HYZ09_01265 [Candidatus Kerfeldbacteria bacterium]|nr:hypothetical protein [Candidatus Kerfeldbacteria bacterium]
MTAETEDRFDDCDEASHLREQLERLMLELGNEHPSTMEALDRWSQHRDTCQQCVVYWDWYARVGKKQARAWFEETFGPEGVAHARQLTQLYARCQEQLWSCRLIQRRFMDEADALDCFIMYLIGEYTGERLASEVRTWLQDHEATCRTCHEACELVRQSL